MTERIVKIQGIKKAQRALKLVNRELFNKADDAIHKAGFIIEGEVKKSIAGQKPEPKSVDTGRFLRSIFTDNTQTLRSRIFTNIRYAPFLEFGTTSINPRRHFKNTAARNERRVIDFVSNSLR